MKVANWGNYPVTEAEIRSFSDEKALKNATHEWDSFIARGLGRCYGDSSLSPHILSSLSFDRFLDFDAENGILTAQSGVSFEEILKVFVAKGWFLPVTPGTKFITVGGAIASDIHGKNHHSEGCFSNHLHSLRLLTGRGDVLNCSRTENPDAFWATCGGMGLTGVILDATFQLKKIETAYIKEESIKVKNLDAAIEAFDQSLKSTYSVAWIDCLAKGKNLGKGIVLNGEHAKISDLKKQKHIQAPLTLPKKGKFSVPFQFPPFVMNKLTIKAFNTLFYAKAPKGHHSRITDYDTYFYPLDGIHHWNRVYGKRGFAQYQFVIAPEHSYEGLKAILGEVSKRGLPSFLTVLKWFGKEAGMISFPKEGYTVALDFPRTKSLFKHLDALDELVLKYNGRLYLTKDSRMKPEMFQKSYPNLGKWNDIRTQLDPESKMASLQSRRLGI